MNLFTQFQKKRFRKNGLPFNRRYAALICFLLIVSGIARFFETSAIAINVPPGFTETVIPGPVAGSWTATPSILYPFPSKW